ncbi:unnamed protein product [Lactuca virosa]|uniref:Uncharacterized protein n=1 Tax=Lactuca virosa TaxID=75947 RepID=A0AAU9M7L3_9ASTR|nr:unnamed protein product [Lactuca virosa]
MHYPPSTLCRYEQLDSLSSAVKSPLKPWKCKMEMKTEKEPEYIEGLAFGPNRNRNLFRNATGLGEINGPSTRPLGAYRCGFPVGIIQHAMCMVQVDEEIAM